MCKVRLQNNFSLNKSQDTLKELELDTSGHRLTRLRDYINVERDRKVL